MEQQNIVDLFNTVLVEYPGHLKKAQQTAVAASWVRKKVAWFGAWHRIDEIANARQFHTQWNYFSLLIP